LTHGKVRRARKVSHLGPEIGRIRGTSLQLGVSREFGAVGEVPEAISDGGSRRSFLASSAPGIGHPGAS